MKTLSKQVAEVKILIDANGNFTFVIPTAFTGKELNEWKQTNKTAIAQAKQQLKATQEAENNLQMLLPTEKPLTKNKATREIKKLVQELNDFTECINSQYKAGKIIAWYLGNTFTKAQAKRREIAINNEITELQQLFY